ncbi:aspartic peptidase A1 [Obba rivulosa]|uniref:Aspartic peptidase A1 n=1 Tax=Obba rivulosa TaxID=1052685 RepID=A0A8E2DGF6_9APHY|nr:aspartic peptidase A1 [Obba rivulosa]
MFPAVSLLLLCTLAVTAKPVVVRDSPLTLPIVRNLNLTGGATIADIDRARVQGFRDRSIAPTTGASAAAAVFNIPVTNAAVSYTATVGVGSPATDYTLIVDTGSSNTWIGAGKSYVKTSTSKSTGSSVSVEYGSGSFSGTEYTDTVTLGSLVITNQGVGVASRSSGFEGVDGILGIGPVDLTDGTLSRGGSIPTVTDNAFSQGLISAHEVGISFEPTTSESSTNGELTFGGTDSSKFTGSISFTSITTTSPAGDYVGIDQSITYGSASGTSVLSNTAGIVDTGTTLLYIATDALSRYIKAVGASSEPDEETGLYTISSANFAKLESLFFNIGSESYEFTANAQIWPRSLNSAIGGKSGTIYLVVNDIGSDTGSGLDFINGLVWLERFYFVYSAGSNEVGFATTSFTDATTN